MPFRRGSFRYLAIGATQLVFLISSISYAGADDSRKLLEFDFVDRLILVNPYPAIDGTIQIVVHAKNGDGTNLSRWPLVKMNTHDGRGYFARLESVASKDWNKWVFYRFVPVELNKTTSIEIDGQQAAWGSN